MKIKVKALNENCKPEILKQGEWIDLKTESLTTIAAPYFSTNSSQMYSELISLGIAMQLPKYFEAHVLPRSGTYNKYKVILTNGMGIIDSSYCGDNDIWKFNALSLEGCSIPAGTRIAQFRIQPSQFAPWYIKLKWLFTNKIEFEFVDNLDNNDRGGFGSTGV